MSLRCDLGEQGLLWTWGHPGTAMAEIDLDRDGEREVLWGLRHDAPEGSGAALIALDSRKLGGFVPHAADASYFPPDSGSEGVLAYVVFPPGGLTPAGYKSYVHSITPMPDTRQVRVIVSQAAGAEHQAQSWFWLNEDLSVLRVQFTDLYKAHCQELGCPWDEVAEEELASRVIRLK